MFTSFSQHLPLADDTEKAPFVFAYNDKRTFPENLWDCQDLMEQDPSTHAGFIDAIVSADETASTRSSLDYVDKSLGIWEKSYGKPFFQALAERSPAFRTTYCKAFPEARVSATFRDITFFEDEAKKDGATRESVLKAMQDREPLSKPNTIETKFRKTFERTHPDFQAMYPFLLPKSTGYIHGTRRPTGHGSSGDMQLSDAPFASQAVVDNAASQETAETTQSNLDFGSPFDSVHGDLALTDVQTRESVESSLLSQCTHESGQAENTDVLVPVPDGYTKYTYEGRTVLQDPRGFYWVWDENQRDWVDPQVLEL